jgi:predicted dehydrogenase
MNDTTTRREFLGDTGRTLGAAAMAVGVHTMARAEPRTGPADTVTVGLIGCGGMGRANLRFFMNHPEVRIAALCDIDKTHLEGARRDVAETRKKQGRDAEHCATHGDFRQLLDHKEIDAIICGTPDHWHALVTIFACQAGKDVYCEKPISHNVVEGRAMVNAVKRNRRVCQIGTQQRSGEHFQKAIELVRNGALGKVYLTRTWNHTKDNSLGNPPDGEPPAGVDYDTWLGPAPKRAFNRNRFHGTWRWFFDYGTGMVGDWNVHLQDIVHLAMRTGRPKSVCAIGGKFAIDDNRDTPDLIEAVYEFEGPTGPFVQVYTMRKFNENPREWSSNHGIQFVGTQGTMNLNRGGFEIIPEGKQAEAVKSGGSAQNEPHVRNFLDCVKSRDNPRSDIKSMHDTTACCHLANISYKVGRKLYWDAAAELCYRDPDHKTPDSEANALLGREYRKPWALPKIDPA